MKNKTSMMSQLAADMHPFISGKDKAGNIAQLEVDFMRLISVAASGNDAGIGFTAASKAVNQLPGARS